MSLLSDVESCRPIEPRHLKPAQRRLHNIIAWSYPQHILRRLRATPGLHAELYHQLRHALETAEHQCSYHLPTLLRRLPERDANAAAAALEALGLGPPPGVHAHGGGGGDKVVFFDPERERLWEVTHRLFAEGVVGGDLGAMVARGEVPPDFDTLHALHQLRWQNDYGSRHVTGDLTSPRHPWYHTRKLDEIRGFLEVLEPVARAFGYHAPPGGWPGRGEGGAWAAGGRYRDDDEVTLLGLD
ncbi:hypothetical protein NKR23_g4094 [Pleurostoma richardsiae]|uniref:Uncharacterized protein n=1 Tax=Pleurostoma richardsiae TaxID=41990 RepID=A0AA38RXE0_9PEZI|nr:hypothetical protein NKR23_g4094 [Pleurostoma richardsiae]